MYLYPFWCSEVLKSKRKMTALNENTLDGVVEPDPKRRKLSHKTGLSLNPLKKDETYHSNTKISMTTPLRRKSTKKRLKSAEFNNVKHDIHVLEKRLDNMEILKKNSKKDKPAPKKMTKNKKRKIVATFRAWEKKDSDYVVPKKDR
eukprot:UN08299